MSAKFEKYKFARHNIDLVEANVVDMSVTKRTQVGFAEKVFNELGLETLMDVEKIHEDRVLIAILQVTVKSFLANEKGQKKDECNVVNVEVKIRGVFEKKDQLMTNKEFANNTQTLIVPLLLPYARTAIATVSALIDGPQMTIPSMDIISSLEQNSD